MTRSRLTHVHRLLTAFVVSVMLSIAGTAGVSAVALASRSLPAGNSYYAFDCSGGLTTSITTFNVNTGVGTVVGTPVLPTHAACAFGASYDPVSQSAYWVSTISNSSHCGGLDTYLMRANLTTGVSTEIGLLQATGACTTPAVTSTAIDASGHAYAIAFESGNVLYDMDLVTHQLTNRRVLSPAMNSKCMYAFAYNPTDGHFYANCEDRYFYRVDVASGAVTLACKEPVNYWGSDGIAFDSNGIGWTGYGMPPNGQQPIGILSFDVSQPDCNVSTSIAMTVAAIPNWDSYANAISYPLPAPLPTSSTSAPTPTSSPEPTLAVTGAGWASSLAVASGGMIILGAVLPLIWRRKRA